MAESLLISACLVCAGGLALWLVCKFCVAEQRAFVAQWSPLVDVAVVATQKVFDEIERRKMTADPKLIPTEPNDVNWLPPPADDAQDGAATMKALRDSVRGVTGTMAIIQSEESRNRYVAGVDPSDGKPSRSAVQVFCNYCGANLSGGKNCSKTECAAKEDIDREILGRGQAAGESYPGEKLPWVENQCVRCADMRDGSSINLCLHCLRGWGKEGRPWTWESAPSGGPDGRGFVRPSYRIPVRQSELDALGITTSLFGSRPDCVRYATKSGAVFAHADLALNHSRLCPPINELSTPARACRICGTRLQDGNCDDTCDAPCAAQKKRYDEVDKKAREMTKGWEAHVWSGGIDRDPTIGMGFTGAEIDEVAAERGLPADGVRKAFTSACSQCGKANPLKVMSIGVNGHQLICTDCFFLPAPKKGEEKMALPTQESIDRANKRDRMIRRLDDTGLKVRTNVLNAMSDTDLERLNKSLDAKASREADKLVKQMDGTGFKLRHIITKPLAWGWWGYTLAVRIAPLAVAGWYAWTQR